MATDNDSLESAVSADDRALAQIFRSLVDDPKTRKQALLLVKAKNPNQPIPEIDTEAAVLARIKPVEEKYEALEKKMLAKEVEGNIASRRLELREQGFAADDIKAIEEMMVKEGIPNHGTAANYYKLQKQAATPTIPNFTSSVNKLPIDKKGIKEAGGIKNWAREEAARAINDFQSGKVKMPAIG